MKAVRPLILFVFVILIVPIARADGPMTRDTYCNPLDVLCADPFIYREGNTYYLYATAAEDGLLVWTSENLVDWRLRGHAFKRSRQTWSQSNFWAPELFKHNGKYDLHFTAEGPLAPGAAHPPRRIVLSEGSSPLGPFHEVKAPWFDAGQTAIDSDVFTDDDGKMYLYSVYTGQEFDKRFQITVRKLDADLKPDSHETFCTSPSLPWEGHYVNEGPFVLKHNGFYVLTYSANGYHDPNYCIGFATAPSPLGPWKKHAEGPILHRSATVSGPGHHCFIDSPDHSELFITYHTHQFLKEPGPPRQLAIDRVKWTTESDGKTPLMEIGAATDTPQPMPSGSKPLVRGQSDEFDLNELNRGRWTVFNEDPRDWRLAGGRLTIQTVDGDCFEDRSDLENLFLEYAPFGDFDVQTRVSIDPQIDYQQGFLMLWQDHNDYAKISFLHTHGAKMIEIGMEKDAAYTSHLHPTKLTNQAWLEIRRHGSNCEFLESADGRNWESVEKGDVPLVDLRVGIGACSPGASKSTPAGFDFIHFNAAR